MARATHIYLIYDTTPLGDCAMRLPISCHTVKREAHEWVKRHGFDFDKVLLFRMRDNDGQRYAEFIDWDEKLK